MSSRIIPETAAPTTASTPPSTRDRAAIWALAVGSGISQTGNGITGLAIPWFVLITTGSAARTGLAAAIIAVSPILAGLLGGPIIDRLGFKRSSVIADALSGITVLLVPILYLFDILNYWQLIALVFLGAFFDVPGSTARTALVVDLARRARMSLERGNSIMQLSFTLSDVVLAPLLAGALISAVGAANVLFFDAATFATSILIIGLLVPARAAGRGETVDDGDTGSSGFLEEMAAGFRFFMRDRVLRTMLPAAVIMNFLGMGLAGVLLPVYVQESFGEPTYLGFIFAAYGIGALVGAALFGAYGQRFSRYGVFLACFAVAAVAFWLFALLVSLPANLAAMFLFGITLGPLNPLLRTIVQARTPERMLGRVSSALVTLFTIAAPLGALIAGFSAEWLGVRGTFIASATLLMLIPLWLGLNPRSRAVAPEFDA